VLGVVDDDDDARSRKRMQCRGSPLITGTDSPYCSAVVYKMLVPRSYSRKNFWNLQCRHR